MEKQNNETSTTQEVVSYSKDKIQLLFNILNTIQFTGIQQAQAIAQISVILGDPITENKTTESGD